MKLIPLQDWAVIIPTEAEARTAGGLFIPDTAKEKPEEGVVEAIGPGALEEEKHGRKKDETKERKFIPTVVKPGDRVLYERWAGRNYKIGTEERILVRERSILGLIDRPLQIPAKTSHQASTALVERQVSVPSTSLAQSTAGSPVKAGKKKPAKSAPKKKAAKSPKTKKLKKSAAKPAKRVKKAAKSKKSGKKK